MRWHYRYETWVRATRYRQEWSGVPPGYEARFAAHVQDLAKSFGFFSLWFDAFHDVPRVKEALLQVQAFPGTAANSFRLPDFDPIERVPGDL